IEWRELGDVCTGSKKIPPDCGEKQPRASPIIGNCGLEQDPRVYRSARIILRISSREVLRDVVQISSSLRESYSRLEPAQGRKPGMISAAKNRLLGAQFVERQIDFRQAREPHLFGNYADDFPRNAIDQNLLSNDAGLPAKSPVPQLFCNKRDLATVRQIGRCGKIAPKCRRRAQDAEKVPSHARGTCPLRRCFTIFAREIDAVAPEQYEIGKAALGLTPIEVVRIANGAGLESLRALAQKNETIGMRVRQRSQ